MKRFLLLLTVLGAVHLPVFGQGDTLKTSRSIKYSNSFSFGALIAKGEDVSTFSFETIHGVRVKRFFVGLGVGYDTYTEWNIVPLMASLSFDLINHRSNAFFVKVSGGKVLADDVLPENSGSIYSFDKGSMINSTLGYRLSTDKCQVYFSAGYKIQTINYQQGYRWWWGGVQTDIQREIQRITVSIGVGLH
jgi:hypothetical protein